MAKQRIAVLFGGASKDYQTSLKSAYSVLYALPQEKYEIIPIGITKAGRWLYFPGNFEEIKNGSWETNIDCCSAVLSPDPLHRGIIKILGDGQTSLQRIDIIFSVLHGKYGECGRIQSLCKLSGIAFVGSDFDASNACNDQMLTYLILEKAGIKIPDYYYLERVYIDNLDDYLPDIEKKIKYPAYVKAASCSYSIGANIAQNRDQLRNAVKIAFSHHHKVLVEEALIGRELECAVIGNVYTLKTSEIGELKVLNGNPNSKYIKKNSSFKEADLDYKTREIIFETSKLAFRAMGCKNFARFDYKLTDKGLYLCKVNNLPGFTEASILPQLMKISGYGYGEFLEEIINLAVDSRN